MDTPPETIEPGEQKVISGEPTSITDDGVVHLYYTYGENFVAEFSGWWVPDGAATKCSHEAGSSEISVGCHTDGFQNKFTITDASATSNTDQSSARDNLPGNEKKIRDSKEKSARDLAPKHSEIEDHSSGATGDIKKLIDK